MRYVLALLLLVGCTPTRQPAASDALVKENADLRAQVRETEAKWAEVQRQNVEVTELNWRRRMERDEARRERDAARAATQP